MSALAAAVLLAVAASDDAGSKVDRVLELRRELAALEASLTDAERAELAARLAPKPAAPSPVETPAPPPPVAALPPEIPAAPASGCPTLAYFDSDGDGQVSAADRSWRHLYGALDRDADGRFGDEEITSLYELGVRTLAADGRSWKGTRERAGEIRGGEELRLELEDGEATLLVDATALSRRSGPQLFDEAGRLLDGRQALRSGWSIRDAAGAVVVLACR